MAALDLPAEYLEAFSTGVVAAGDLVNLSVDLLPAEWVRVHRVPGNARDRAARCDGRHAIGGAPRARARPGRVPGDPLDPPRPAAQKKKSKVT